MTDTILEHERKKEGEEGFELQTALSAPKNRRSLILFRLMFCFFVYFF
jgi:hypothetical protein